MYNNRPTTIFAENVKMKRLLYLLAVIAITSTAQEISYPEYMQRVMEGNIALTAKKDRKSVV